MAGLRARLFAALAILVVLTALTAGGLAYRWAFAEAIELQDAILVQIGQLALKTRLRAEFPAPSNVDAEARIVVEELDEPGHPRPAGGLLDIPHDLPNGLQTLSLGGETWRVLARTRLDGSRVAIAQPTAARDEIARDSALRTVLPLGALVPCLMLLVGFVIAYSFRPVMRLASQLDAKESNHLQRLPTEGIPMELHPFIESINRLLERISVLFDGQRRFIAHAAHELRTPITALGIQAENLEHAELPEEKQMRLAALKSGIRRTAHLLEQLLDLAKYDGGDPSKAPVVRLDSVVKDVVADFLPLARARCVDLGFEGIENTPVRVNSAGLAALTRNLVDNALRYSPDGGQIDIRVLRQGGCALLRIEDTGPGVPPAELDRIFEPFNRGVRSADEGTGLGLSIVRRVVDNHDGSVRLENLTSAGKTGLRVTVSFPLA